MRAAIVLFALSLFWLSGEGSAADAGPTAAVAGGEIRGSFEEDGRVAVFKGIPYAAPPVGDLRWKPPQPGSMGPNLCTFTLPWASTWASPRNVISRPPPS